MPKRISTFKQTVRKPTPLRKEGYLEKVEKEVESNQSKVSLILGALIVLVIGILVFNYFSRDKSSLGPAQQTEISQESSSNAPTKHTVAQGETLFTIANQYYQDGYKYTEIVKANNLVNPDLVEAGQVLEIPKMEARTLMEAETSPQPIPSAQPQNQTSGNETLGTGGGNATIWGPRIEGDKYTVEAEDWLSKIAGRSYGDVMAFDKIAKANNISNPDLIEPGTVLTIPR